MTDTIVDAEDAPVEGSTVLVELGNPRPHERVNGELRPLEIDRGAPAVSYLRIPFGPDRAGNPLYSFPDAHDDSQLPDNLAQALAGVPDPEARRSLRRLLLDGHFGHASGVKGLPNHAAAVAVIHPGGFWNEVSLPSDEPSWVWSSHPGLQKFLAEHYGVPAGRPDNVEDTHYTQYGSGVYPPGAKPDPLSGVTALHTSWGRDLQSIAMGGWGYLGTAGTGGTYTATSTGVVSAETGVSHGANDCAGNVIYVSSTAPVYGLITANTSGTTPTYTVDQWYSPSAPGGAVGANPATSAKYQIISGGSAGAIFVALSTDTTTPVLLGAGGTADAASITQTLTSEINVASGGLNRKIAPIGHTAGAATWTATPVFTANGSDVLPKVVAKAALSPSNVNTVGAISFMTPVSPTATLSASGDQLTLSWSFTMT